MTVQDQCAIGVLVNFATLAVALRADLEQAPAFMLNVVMHAFDKPSGDRYRANELALAKNVDGGTFPRGIIELLEWDVLHVQPAQLG